MDDQFAQLIETQARLREHFEKLPEPLFPAAKPTTIKVGKLNGPLTETPLADFEAQEKITWSTSPVIGYVARAAFFHDTTFSRGFNSGAAEVLLRDMTASFAVCDINETVGKGLLFIPTATTPVLKIGTPIGLYSGVLSSTMTGVVSDYGFTIETPPDPQCPSVFETLPKLGKPYFNAQYFRNFTSYAQHAPNEETLSEIKNLPDEIKAHVARANVVGVPSVHCGIDVLTYCTTRDIDPQKNKTASEQILVDYGKKYFAGKPYQLFDTQGNVVGSVNANNEFEKNPHYEPKEKPPKHSKALPHAELLHIINKNMGKTFDSVSFYFFEHAKFLIWLYQKRALPGTEEILTTFATALSQTKDPGKAHDIIDEIVTIKNLLDPHPDLHPLKQELICLLNTHCIYLETLKKYSEELQGNKKTCPLNWSSKKETWKTYDIEGKNHFGFFGRVGDLRKAKKDLSHLSPIITKLGGKDLLAIAVSVMFEREMEKDEKKQATMGKKK